MSGLQQQFLLHCCSFWRIFTDDKFYGIMVIRSSKFHLTLTDLLGFYINMGLSYDFMIMTKDLLMTNPTSDAGCFHCFNP